MIFENVSTLQNVDLGKTQITDKVRVSSAAIFYDEIFGTRYQIETFIFSDDPKVKTRQIIHDSIPVRFINGSQVVDRCKKIHKYISDNLIKKFAP